MEKNGLHLVRFTPQARAHITHRTVTIRFDCRQMVCLQEQGATTETDKTMDVPLHAVT
jgi:hypothetical protein